jgi:hypothetical protein
LISRTAVELLRQRFIDVGELRISRTSLGKKRAGERYLIYLPLNRNYLWRALHERGAKVRVFIEIPSGALSDETAAEQTKPQ